MTNVWSNPAKAATQTVTVDEDKVAEPPQLILDHTALTVPAHGSVPLGIDVAAVDADDGVSVKITGVASYETITATDGHAVAKSGVVHLHSGRRDQRLDPALLVRRERASGKYAQRSSYQFNIR